MTTFGRRALYVLAGIAGVGYSITFTTLVPGAFGNELEEDTGVISVETAADGAVSIIFSDDTEFRLSASSRMGLDGFVDGTSNSALFSLTQGAFAFIAGKLLAKTGGLRIDTPLGSIRAALSIERCR